TRLSRDGAAIAELWGLRSKGVGESFAAITDVILNRARPEMVARVGRHSAAIAAAQARIAAIAQTPRYALECIALAALVTAALWLQRGAGGGQWLPQLAFLAFATYRLLPPVQQAYTAL